jgi:hypothetical protein
MAGFHTKTFLNYDDYMTPKYAWDNIKQYIPKDKKIWEAFYGNGCSGRYLKELGFKTIHKKVDFYKENLGDVIVSNPPFSDIKNIMIRLKELDKPFILILPSSKINTSYFREWKDKHIQIIIPRKRIHFLKAKKKNDNIELIENYKSCCNFDCFYYCYKINLDKDITWLD